jgi:SAM-dependent methyltransferase
MTERSAPVRRGTGLTALADRFGSDKGFLRRDAHGYTRFYEMLLAPLRDRPLAVLEIGLLVGGPEAADGVASRRLTDAPSARMWLEYLPRARIVGFDICEGPEIADDRFVFVRGDMGAPADLARAAAACPDGFDLIVDDGSHASWHQQVALAALLPALKPGGWYVIEDLHWQPAHLEAAHPAPLTAGLIARFIAERRIDPALYETADRDLGARLADVAGLIGGAVLLPDGLAPDGAPKLAWLQRRIDDDEPADWHHRSGVRRRAGRRDEALALARQAVAADPGHFDARFNMIELLLAAGAAETEPAAAALCADFPREARAHALRAGVLARDPARLAEARRAQEAAVRCAPDDPGRHLYLAELLVREGLTDTAVGVIRGMLQRWPAHGGALALGARLGATRDPDPKGIRECD